MKIYGSNHTKAQHALIAEKPVNSLTGLTVQPDADGNVGIRTTIMTENAMGAITVWIQPADFGRLRELMDAYDANLKIKKAA